MFTSSTKFEWDRTKEACQSHVCFEYAYSASAKLTRQRCEAQSTYERWKKNGNLIFSYINVVSFTWIVLFVYTGSAASLAISNENVFASTLAQLVCSFIWIFPWTAKANVIIYHQRQHHFWLSLTRRCDKVTVTRPHLNNRANKRSRKCSIRALVQKAGGCSSLAKYAEYCRDSRSKIE